VIGFNRSRGPVDQLVSAGGKGANSVAEAVQEADVIITMVPDSPDVEGAGLGEDGIYANPRRGSTHIDMSSPWSQISDQCGQFMHRLPKSDPKLRTGRNFDD
jgi:3-hydroxyisobutyrate dehydrogenase-like beta-hydroxyacid dehydrogenase